MKEERSQWRDLALSERHRVWGHDCPMVDIDFLVTDYDHGKPVAIIEYKNELADEENTHAMSYRALKALANASKIPCFVCRYGARLDWFKPRSLNGFAKDHGLDDTTLTEEEWVGFLYKLRGREVPLSVLTDIRKPAVEPNSWNHPMPTQRTSKKTTDQKLFDPGQDLKDLTT